MVEIFAVVSFHYSLPNQQIILNNPHFFAKTTKFHEPKIHKSWKFGCNPKEWLLMGMMIRQVWNYNRKVACPGTYLPNWYQPNRFNSICGNKGMNERNGVNFKFRKKKRNKIEKIVLSCPPPSPYHSYFISYVCIYICTNPIIMLKVSEQ